MSWSYAGGTESYTFDNYDRVTQITNPLGTFTQTYEGDTGILNEVQCPLAGMKTTYQRLPAAQDRLLTAIIHTKPTSQGGGELARYDYTYNAQRQIATWRQMQPGMDAKEWAIAYDARQQVTAVVETPVAGPPQNPQQVWRYQYDASGNRTAAQEGSRTRTATYNDLNQLISQTAGGSTWFRGKVNEPANVTIAGQNARVSADGTFESLTPVGAGQQDVLMEATDKAGNTTRQNWRVDNGPAGTVTTTHDAEGNLLSDGRYTYTWDAKNRMTSVTLGTDTWTFQYDGQNRRIAESKNGVPLREWVWNNTQIVEERTVAGGGKQRRWTGGVELLNSSNQQTAKRLLITDHLGSSRAAIDGTSGTTTASYAFSPWGKRSRISGTEDLSNGYTGHLWHESGLSLAVYRPYDPETGRWVQRDLILEKGGLNLYCYTSNSPIKLSDYKGLSPSDVASLNVTYFSASPNQPPSTGLPLQTAGGLSLYPSGNIFSGEMIVKSERGGMLMYAQVMTGGWVNAGSRLFSGDINDVTPRSTNTNIPSGSYKAQTKRSGAVDGYLVLNVTGRSGIYIHYGSISAGCIVLPNDGSWGEFSHIMDKASKCKKTIDLNIAPF